MRHKKVAKNLKKNVAYVQRLQYYIESRINS